MAKIWRPIAEAPADNTACWLLWRDRTCIRMGYHYRGRYHVGTPRASQYDCTEIITHYAAVAALANLMPEQQ
jgi:hypothetical protein